MNHQDDNRAEDVRALFAAAKVPPPWVNIEQAVASGRRIRRRRRWAMGAAASMTAAAVVGIAVAAQTLRDVSPDTDGPPPVVAASAPIPTPAPTPSLLPADTLASCNLVRQKTWPYRTDVVVDPTGHFMAADSRYTDRPLIWVNGRIVEMPPKLRSVSVRDINSAGVLVGAAYQDQGAGQLGWILRGESVTTLLPPDGYTSVIPQAINERGDVVGDAYGPKTFAAVRWPAGTAGRGEVLAAPKPARALDVTSDGTVVGSLGDGDAPYVWAPDGTGRPLPNPPGTRHGMPVAVRGEWAVGWVTSSIESASASPRPSTTSRLPKSHLLAGKDRAGIMAARWNLATGAVSSWPEYRQVPTDVNAQGWMPLSTEDGGVGVLTETGQLLRLPAAMPARPVAISDDGRRIVGLLDGDPIQPQVLTWDC